MKTPSPYFSFLICAHPYNVGVYYNGMPIGVVSNNKFNPYEFILLNGDKKVITLNEIKEPFPFKDLGELKTYLIEVVNSIQLGEVSKVEDKSEKEKV